MTRDLDFEEFMRENEPRLRQACVARYGRDIGREVAADALAYAWEHWDRVRTMKNPTGYLFRVSQSKARRYHRRGAALVGPQDDRGSPGAEYEPELERALAALTDRQRAAVVLIVGLGWTHRDVATALHIRKSTVQNHLERGLAVLRVTLNGDDDEHR